MRRSALALALILAAVGTRALAQEEPPLFANPPAPEKPAASPTPVPALPSAPPASPLGALPPGLDFTRWQQMTARERQTFVEGAVAALNAFTQRLRTDVSVARGLPHERLAGVVKFVTDSAPRRAASAYLKEMERIYMTTEGQKLSILEGFQKAFERLNIPAAVTPPPQASPSPAAQPGTQ